MSDQRKPLPAWESRTSGKYLGVVLHKTESYDHRLIVRVYHLDGFGWFWDMCTTACGFRTENAESEESAQFAAEDELVRIARELLAVLAILPPEQPEKEHPIADGATPIHVAMNRERAVEYFGRRRDKLMNEIRTQSPADKLRTAADFIDAVKVGDIPDHYLSTARELCQLVTLGLPERKRG